MTWSVTGWQQRISVCASLSIATSRQARVEDRRNGPDNCCCSSLSEAPRSDRTLRSDQVARAWELGTTLASRAVQPTWLVHVVQTHRLRPRSRAARQQLHDGLLKGPPVRGPRRVVAYGRVDTILSRARPAAHGSTSQVTFVLAKLGRARHLAQCWGVAICMSGRFGSKATAPPLDDRLVRTPLCPRPHAGSSV